VSKPLVRNLWSNRQALFFGMAPHKTVSFQLTDTNNSTSIENIEPLLKSEQKPNFRSTLQKWRKTPFLSGWRSGIVYSTITSSLILLINIIFLIRALRYSIPLSKDGIGTLFEGSCKKVENLGTVLHLVINILGSVLIRASDSTRQFLAAPTRREIDSAHRKGKWLEVGIPSLSNLLPGRIATRRVVLWGVFGLSSLPLHLV